LKIWIRWWGTVIVGRPRARTAQLVATHGHAPLAASPLANTHQRLDPPLELVEQEPRGRCWSLVCFVPTVYLSSLTLFFFSQTSDEKSRARLFFHFLSLPHPAGDFNNCWGHPKPTSGFPIYCSFALISKPFLNFNIHNFPQHGAPIIQFRDESFIKKKYESIFLILFHIKTNIKGHALPSRLRNDEARTIVLMIRTLYMNKS
jgi:hypothetical protein